MTTTRIYVITNGDASKFQLIEATSQSQALRHISEQNYTVTVAKPQDIVRIMNDGVKVETAGAGAA